MLYRLVCLLALSSLCLSSSLDVDKIHAELKRESEEVEEEFAGKESQEEQAELRAAYFTSTNGTNEVETEMNIKEELSEDFIEGDIILTPEQRARLIDPDAKATRQRRQADTYVTLWSEEWGIPTIPYSYADGFPDENKNIIADAIKFWESRTCIIFRPANETDKNILEFNHNTTLCNSHIGMIGGTQRFNVAPAYLDMRTITHELGHAFGIMHTQSRYDRDNYITLNKGNIIEGTVRDFEKVPYDNTYGVPYEFGSLMHYDQYAYAINISQPTIIAKDKYSKYQNSMGSPLASFYDVLLINKMYKCTARCNNHISCKNNGVQHGNDCKKCYCPRGWAGDACDTRPYDAHMINLTDSMELRLGVNAAPFKGYAENLFVIEVAPPGNRINASITYMEECQDFWLFRYFEIIPTEDTRINGIHFWGTPDTTTIESESNQMLVWMYNRLGVIMVTTINFTLV